MHIFSNGRRKAAQKCDFRYGGTGILWVRETLRTRKTMKLMQSSDLKCDLKAWKKKHPWHIWQLENTFHLEVSPSASLHGLYLPLPWFPLSLLFPCFPFFPSPFAVIDACLPSPSLQRLLWKREMLWKLRKPVRWDGYFLAASFLQSDCFPIFYSLT